MKTSQLSKQDLNKIKGVIDQEFDTEILYKHKDLDLIEREIGKAEAQLTAIKKYHTKGKVTKPKEEPNRYSRKYTELLSILSSGKTPKKEYGAVNNGYMQTRSQASCLRPVARMRPSTGSVKYKYELQNKCICRRSDNVLVSLKCPKCDKTDFLSPQGFINHCRIAHEIDIVSHDHAAMTCGILLPKDEQDDNGMNALENLELHGLDPLVNLNKPDLSEYVKTNKVDPLSILKGGKGEIIKVDRNIEVKMTDEKPKFSPKFSHLKTLIGDKVDGFDLLVENATEEFDKSDSPNQTSDGEQTIDTSTEPK